MTSVFKLREIQLGLIILFSFYVFSLISGLDLHMMYSHEMTTYISLFLLIILLLTLRIIVAMPHRGALKIHSADDTWFISTFKMIIFIIFFTICTLISTLIAYALHVDRSQDIFTIGMLIANIYYLIITTWTCYNFITMSVIGDNMEFKKRKKK